MKKLLLASAAVAAFSTSVLADDSMFYLRGDFGYHMFNNTKQSFKSGDVQLFGGTAKGKYAPGLEFGVGYNVMENVRAELVYSYLFETTRKSSDSATYTLGDVANGSTQETAVDATYYGLGTWTNASNKAKTRIQALMVKGYYDVADLGFAQIFVGAGIGMSQITTKHSNTNTNTTYTNTSAAAVPAGTAINTATGGNATAVTQVGSGAYKEKKKNNFSWSLALGSAFDVTDSVKVDVQYNYQDFGKSSGKISGITASKAAFRTHSIKLGARFAI